MPYAHQYGPPAKTGRISAVEGITDKVNVKMMNMADTLLKIMASGTFERFPKLKLVLVEQEASWLPFMLTQWDKYIKKQRYDSPMTMLATEYFKRNVFVTFFNDIPIGSLLRDWGQDNCMWSNDFPHQNSTWPNSDKVIARDLGDLPAATRQKVIHDNVMKLYNLPNIAPVEVVSEAVERRA
jgi:predicted TIM-barrel fold metal-dependent hydrolase